MTKVVMSGTYIGVRCLPLLLFFLRWKCINQEKLVAATCCQILLYFVYKFFFSFTVMPVYSHMGLKFYP